MNNQCDGCIRGIPVVNGVHRDAQYFGMVCSKERYTEEPKMSRLQYIPQEGTSTLQVTMAGSGLVVGELYREVDGFYVLDLIRKQGYLPSWYLLELGHKLEELNKEWAEQIDRDLKRLGGLNNDSTTT